MGIEGQATKAARVFPTMGTGEWSTVAEADRGGLGTGRDIIGVTGTGRNRDICEQIELRRV